MTSQLSRITALVIGLAAVAAVAAGAAPQRQAPPDAVIAQARSLVSDLVRAHGIPGLSVAVGKGDDVMWSEGFGLADVEQQIPVSRATRFRLGSVSKVLTAAAIARLVEEGRLDLDAPVQKYVPAFPQKQWPITTRHVVAHTSGIRHYTADDFSGPLASARTFADVNAGLALFADDPLLFEPGTRYTYSTYAWTLASAVIEGASGTDFLTYMQQAIFDPLRMSSTGPDRLSAIVPHRTRFYAIEGGAVRHADHVDNSYKWAGGGFLSTPEDLVRFAGAHLRPGFFRPSTLALLFAPTWKWPGGNWQVGVGWRVGTDEEGRRVYHHGGTIDGGRAMIMVYPDSGVSVVMLSNALARFGEADAQAIGRLFVEAQ